MPAIYGEGRKAFTRLQLEILKTSNDQTIFAWDDSGIKRCGMLADDVCRFQHSSAIEQLEPQELISYGNLSSHRPPSLRFHYELTNFGLHIWLPAQHVFRGSRAPLVRAALDCTDTSSGSPRCPIFITLILTYKNSTFIRCVRTGELPDLSTDAESTGPLKFEELYITGPADWSAVHYQYSGPFRPYEHLELHFHALQDFVLLGHYPQTASTMQFPFVLSVSNGQQFTLQFWNNKTREMLLIHGKLDKLGAWLHLEVAGVPAHHHPKKAEDYYQRYHTRTSDFYRRSEELWSQVYLPSSKVLAIMSVKDLEHPQNPGVFKRLRVNLRTAPPTRALL